MAQERPQGSPLHGKRVYAYIGQTNSTNTTGVSGVEFVTYATEFSVNLTPQNTARAVAMGTDAVADIETHGLVARARLNLLLTSNDASILLALDGTTSDANAPAQELDYVDNVSKVLSKEEFAQMARLDIIISPLEHAPTPETEGDIVKLSDIENSEGYTIRLTSSAIVGFEITGRIGEYTTARLEVETGRFKANAVPATD